MKEKYEWHEVRFYGALVVVCLLSLVPLALTVNHYYWIYKNKEEEGLIERVAEYSTLQSAPTGGECWVELNMAYDGTAWVHRGQVCRQKPGSIFYKTRVKKIKSSPDGRSRFVVLSLDPNQTSANGERKLYEDWPDYYQVFMEAAKPQANGSTGR